MVPLRESVSRPRRAAQFGDEGTGLALARTAWWFSAAPMALAASLSNRSSRGSAGPGLARLGEFPRHPPRPYPHPGRRHRPRRAHRRPAPRPPHHRERSRTEERTQGRDAVKAALTVAGLRRVANHPATRCLLACPVHRYGAPGAAPAPNPARKKLARLDGFSHGHGVGCRNASVAAAHPHCRTGGRQEISPGWRGVRCTPARSGGTPRRRSGSARACRRGARTPPHRTCRPWRRPGAGRG